MEPYTGVDILEVLEGAVRYQAFLVHLMTSLIGPGVDGLRILDFGAGTGTFSRVLRDRGYNIECVEPDLVLGQRLADDGFRVLDSVDRCRADSFDLIYSFNVLEHIAADRAAVAALLAALKPGGKLLLYVPALPVLFSSMDRRIGHLRRYKRQPLIEMVEATGFAIDRCTYVDSLGVPAALTYRLINKSGLIRPSSVRLYDHLFPLSRGMDFLLHRWLGKNLALYAHKPTASAPQAAAVLRTSAG